MHTRVGGADCLQQGIKPPSSTHTSHTDTALSVGSDGLVSELQPLASILQSLPTEVGGIRKHAVVYTCMDVSSHYLAVGSEQGYVWVLDIISGRLLRELSVSDVWLWLHCLRQMREQPLQDSLVLSILGMQLALTFKSGKLIFLQ